MKEALVFLVLAFGILVIGNDFQSSPNYTRTKETPQVPNNNIIWGESDHISHKRKNQERYR